MTSTLRDLIWSIHSSSVVSEYTEKMSMLLLQYPECHAYIMKSLTPEEWVLYPLYERAVLGVCAYGKATSNDVEQEMQRFNVLNIRSESPMKFFINLTDLWMTLLSRGYVTADALLKSGQRLTPKAKMEYALRDQSCKHMSGSYFPGSTSGYIQLSVKEKANPLFQNVLRWKVNYDARTCPCMQREDTLMFCGHLIKMAELLHATDDAETYWSRCVDDMHLSSTYVKCYPQGCIIDPPCDNVKSDRRVRGPLYVNKQGRPRTIRFKSFGQHSATRKLAARRAKLFALQAGRSSCCPLNDLDNQARDDEDTEHDDTYPDVVEDGSDDEVTMEIGPCDDERDHELPTLSSVDDDDEISSQQPLHSLTVDITAFSNNSICDSLQQLPSSIIDSPTIPRPSASNSSSNSSLQQLPPSIIESPTIPRPSANNSSSSDISLQQSPPSIVLKRVRKLPEKLRGDVVPHRAAIVPVLTNDQREERDRLMREEDEEMVASAPKIRKIIEKTVYYEGKKRDTDHQRQLLDEARESFMQAATKKHEGTQKMMAALKGDDHAPPPAGSSDPGPWLGWMWVTHPKGRLPEPAEINHCTVSELQRGHRITMKELTQSYNSWCDHWMVYHDYVDGLHTRDFIQGCVADNPDIFVDDENGSDHIEAVV